MVLTDELEFCHCDLNLSLNELVRAVQGARDAAQTAKGDDEHAVQDGVPTHYRRDQVNRSDQNSG